MNFFGALKAIELQLFLVKMAKHQLLGHRNCVSRPLNFSPTTLFNFNTTIWILEQVFYEYW